ncbi:MULTISPECIES: DinB family protein [unclassified Knoellia]|uniref:DinB family protein n=1 Tax=Knoellia altitudinis TaxID=3404795 RepID=UPI003605E021
MTQTEPTGRTFRDEQLLGTSFEHVDLSGSRFDRVDLSRSTFRSVDLADVDIRNASLRNVRMRGVELQQVEMWGPMEDVRVNGVDIGPLVEAELDRLHPERRQLRPSDADGFREAWSVIDGLWSGTVARARRLEAVDPDLLHESVAEEWSFIETLRHLSMATDSWLGRAILGEPSPWHPLDLPFDEMPDIPAVPRDRDARPTLDEALVLRDGRFDRVRTLLATLTDEQLGETTSPIVGAGWPPEGETFVVKHCLDVLLDEEWWHRQFAERDLTALEARLATDPATRHTGSSTGREES